MTTFAQLYPTKQSVFDAVWDHAVTRRQPRAVEITPNGRVACRYRTPDGHCCFIGALVPDAEYRKGWESRTVDDLLMLTGGDNPEFWNGIGDLTGFLMDLQDIHDRYDPIEQPPVAGCRNFHDYARQRLAMLADEHGLTLPT